MGSPTFKTFASNFMRTYAPLQYKPTSVAQLDSLLRLHFLPALGARQLDRINMYELQEYLVGRREAGLGARTIRNHVVWLRAMFATARHWGLIDLDPTIGLQSPRQPSKEVPFLTPPQLKALVNATPPAFRLTTALPAYVGLRRGEVLALRFDRVDLDGRTLLVEHSKRGDNIHSPKSRASTATVPFPPSLVPIFEYRREIVDDKSGLVLCKRDGSPLSDSFPNRVLKRALTDAGLPAVTYHQLRGSWVYAHMQTGTPLHLIQKLGRWESVETLVKAYGRWLPSAPSSAADALDGVLDEAP